VNTAANQAAICRGAAPGPSSEMGDKGPRGHDDPTVKLERVNGTLSSQLTHRRYRVFQRADIMGPSQQPPGARR